MKISKEEKKFDIHGHKMDSPICCGDHICPENLDLRFYLQLNTFISRLFYLFH